jgi:hypothetical protein
LTVADRNMSRRAAVARRRRDLFRKELTQGTSRRMKLITARRETTLRAKVTRRKRNFDTNQTRDEAGRGTSKRRTFGRRHQPKEEHKNGIRSRDLRQQLRSKSEVNKTLRKVLGLVIGKRAVGISNRVQAIKKRSLWKCRPPPKRLKSLVS